MFICKICGNELKQGQAFCNTCGADAVDNYETVCPSCSAKNGAGSRYCAKCGGILQVMRKPVCVVCGSKNLPGALFCVSCGAPLIVEKETHDEDEVLDARHVKQRLDNMEKERMAAVDREIEDIKAKAKEDILFSKQEIERYKQKVEEDLNRRAEMLDAYRKKLNELGSDDVALLKKMSESLKTYAAYYADPFSQIDEDDIDGNTYVCPVCGTINPVDATSCTHCGRNKARALLLLAKGRIKQSPPVKRKEEIIPAPEEDFNIPKAPSFEEFASAYMNAGSKEEEKEEKEEPKKKNPDNFSQGAQQYCQYPPYYQYPQQGMQQYPPQGQMPSQQMPQGGYYMAPGGYQMTPIVQPVAFVPYVTQEQPLMQYTPTIEQPKQQPVQKPQQTEPAKKKRK